MLSLKSDSHQAMSFCRIFLGILLLTPSGYAQNSYSRMPQASRPAEVKNPIPAVLKIRIAEGKVSADISSSPLHTVLQELADRTGIIFEVRNEPNPLVSVHLSEIPMHDAIERIASGFNLLFLYDESDLERISLVRVLPRTNPVQQPSLYYLGTGAVTKTNPEIETLEQAQKAISSNADLEAREKAVEFLVKAKGAMSVRALVDAMSDTAPEIRMAAIEGLTVLQSRRSLPSILRSLKDPHPGVRQSAVTAVELLGTSRNLKDLKPLTADRNSNVASAAESAIRKLSATAKH